MTTALVPGDLPRGISMRRTTDGRGRTMWRIHPERNLTLSEVIERNFLSIEEAHFFTKGCPITERPGVDALHSIYGLSGIELSPRKLADVRKAVDALRKAKAGATSEADHFHVLVEDEPLTVTELRSSSKPR